MTSVELGENPSDVALLSFTPELLLINITNHGRSTEPAVQAFCTLYNRAALTFVSPSILLQSLPGYFYTQKREIVLKYAS